MPQTVGGETSKDIVSGIAVTSLLIGISVFLPVLGFACALLLPIPILYYRLKIGRLNSAVILLAACVLVITAFDGMSFDLLFFSGLMGLGYVMAECFERRLSLEKTVLYAVGAVLGVGIIGILLYSHARHVDVVSLITAYVAKNLELTVALYKDMGMPEENVHAIKGSLPQIQYVMVRILPSVFTALALLLAWTSLLLARPFLRRKAMTLPDFGALNQWRSPEIMVWGVIACIGAALVGGNAFKLIAINGLIIFAVVYFFQGIAIVSFYFEKKELPRMMRVFLYCFIAMQQLLLLVVIGLGFFDVWLNFRRQGTTENDA